jgi:hypothetical protein
MASWKKLLHYRLKEVDEPSETWPLKDRIHHWWIEKLWDFRQHSKIMRLWWKFAHRYIPKHQYNVIRIRDLEPNYWDPDTRIKHAVFQEVCDFVDFSPTQTDWSEPNRAPIFADLKSVADYWRIERPKLKQQEEDSLMEWHDARFGKGDIKDWIHKINEPHTPEQDALHKKHTDIEQFILDEDKRYMCLAIKHLEYMWH